MYTPHVPVSETTALPVAQRQPVDLYVAGLGTVGAALMRQLKTLPSYTTPLRLIGTCTSRRALWAAEGLPAGLFPYNVADAETTEWSRILPHLEQHTKHPLIFVDATGSADVARHYERLLRAGVHIVTPSKRANTFEQTYFDALIALTRTRGVHYRYETAVGAGLPVIRLLQDLCDTGDHVRSITGCVSGTLTFLFSQVERGIPFSHAARLAVENGYAEPDVRDDLSGEDVARKFLILARTAGFSVEREAITVASLVPEAVRGVPREGVLDALKAYDESWRRQVEEARRAGHVLRYVGRLDEGQISVGVQAVSAQSALGLLDGTDNVFEIHTDRYAESPIIVRGPGAGPEVTAAGVLADVLAIANALQTRVAGV